MDANIGQPEVDTSADAAAMQEAIHRSRLDARRSELQASNMGESSRAPPPEEDTLPNDDQPQPFVTALKWSDLVEEADDDPIDHELLDPRLFKEPSPPPAPSASQEQHISPEERLADEQSDPFREPPPFQVPNGPLLVDPLPELPRSLGPLLNRGTTFVDYSSGIPSYGFTPRVPDAPSNTRHPAIPTNEANPHPTLWYEPSGNPFIAHDGSWIEPSLYGCPYDLGDEGPRSNLDFEQWMMSVGARRYYGLLERDPDMSWAKARDILKAAWDQYWMAL